MGARRLIGEYIATPKNGMVKDHYANLGFCKAGSDGKTMRYTLDLAGFTPCETFVAIDEEGAR
ncbi:MAG: hypothetical protein JO032_20930, partial [Alphaproteobacteria bacterium]|nr:hypothetical protein [Alphaproteobacteria bacterium]